MASRQAVSCVFYVIKHAEMEVITVVLADF